MAWPVSVSVGAITFGNVLKDVDLMVQQVDALMYRARKKAKGASNMRKSNRLQATAKLPTSSRQKRRQRLLCHRQARVRREGQEGDETQFAIIRNISAGGISVYLESRFLKDTLLIVEPLISGGVPLLARVANLTPDGKGWRHGCEVAIPLNNDDMAFWLEASTAAVENDKAT